MKNRIGIVIVAGLLLVVQMTAVYAQEEENSVLLPLVVHDSMGIGTPTVEPPTEETPPGDGTIVPTGTVTGTVMPDPTEPVTETVTVTVEPTEPAEPIETPTPTPTSTQLHLIFDIREDELYLDLVPKEESLALALVLAPGARNSFPYTLTGDIVGDVYDFSLMLAVGELLNNPAADDIRFGVELLANQEVIAGTVFTATSTMVKRFERTVTGIDPDTARGDPLSLQLTNLSSTGLGEVMVWHPKDLSSYIRIPLGDNEDVTPEPTDTPDPDPTDDPTGEPTEEPTETPEPGCTARAGAWVGENSQDAFPVTFTVTDECTVTDFVLELPSSIEMFKCVIEVPGTLPIVDNAFSFLIPGFEGIEVTGEFLNESEAAGTYDIGALFSCGAPIKPPREGTWTAQPE